MRPDGPRRTHDSDVQRYAPSSISLASRGVGGAPAASSRERTRRSSGHRQSASSRPEVRGCSDHFRAIEFR